MEEPVSLGSHQIQPEKRTGLLDHLLVGAFLRGIGRRRASDRLRSRTSASSGSRSGVSLNGSGVGGSWLLRFLLTDAGRHPQRRPSRGPSPSYPPTPPRGLKTKREFNLISKLFASFLFLSNLEITIRVRTKLNDLFLCVTFYEKGANSRHRERETSRGDRGE